MNDVYRKAASIIFDLPEESITEEQRRAVKSGIDYGLNNPVPSNRLVRLTLPLQEVALIRSLLLNELHHPSRNIKAINRILNRLENACSAVNRERRV